MNIALGVIASLLALIGLLAHAGVIQTNHLYDFGMVKFQIEGREDGKPTTDLLTYAILLALGIAVCF